MHSFQPNCTLPTQNSTFVSAPNIRGTLNIVWSCIIILLLSTWNIQNLNIPFQVKAHTAVQKLRRDVVRARNQLFWMAVTIVAPEYVVGKAFADFVSARGNTKELCSWAIADGVDWGLAHSFYADMGGFQILFPPKEVGNSSPGPPSEESRSVRHEGGDEVVLPQSPEVKIKPATALDSKRAADDLDPVTEADETIPLSYFAKAIHRPIHSSRYRKKGAMPTMTDIKESISYYATSKTLHFTKFPKNNTKARFSAGTPLWNTDPVNTSITANLANANFDVTQLQGRSPRQWYMNIMPLQGNIWVLDAHQLSLARSMGIINQLPLLSHEELEDRNKTDILVRIIALFQVGWLMIQLIVRAAKGLSSSQLEIMTLAFAVCMILSSLFLFSKPQGSRTPVYIQATRYATEHEIIQIALHGPLLLGQRKSYVLQNDALHRTSLDSSQLVEFVVGSIGGSIIFGALHLLAWRFYFPTHVEKLLWQISTLIATFLPLITVCLGPVAVWISTLVFGDKPGSKSLRWFGYFTGFSYTICRIFIIVEACRSLYFLPAEAYVSTWASNLPHF